MKTYQMTLMGKTVKITMSTDNYKKAKGSIVKVLQAHHYSIEERPATASHAAYAMEMWTPTPQWQPSIDQKNLMLSFWQALPDTLKTKDLEWLLPKCQEYFDKFRADQIAAGLSSQKASV